MQCFFDPLFFYQENQRITKWNMFLTELKANVYGNGDCSYNTDTKRGEKCVK